MGGYTTNSGGGGGGVTVTVTEDTIASTKACTSGTAADTGLEVAFTTTLTDEWVVVNYIGVARTAATNPNSGSFVLELKLDAGTNVPAVSITGF